MHKVYIRPLEIEDASVSFKWRNDSEVWSFTGSRPDREITYEIELEWVKKVLKEETSRRFAIIVDETYVGNIQLTDINKQSAEYHIFIGEKSFWGKGISILATYEILHYAKEEIGLQNVYLSVREDNIYAVKSYIKSFFTKISEENGWIKMICDLALLLPPIVNVFVMVYNHEKYLAECLDGILMQKCNFSYIIVVGEDASTDKSREILLKYKSKYPGKFQLILHEKNVGAMANQMAILKACTGKYIALCEGDDYWTDPYKLQKQVDFLDANEDFVMCFTNTKIKVEETGAESIAKINIWDVCETQDILRHNSLDGRESGEEINSPGHTSTILFRNNLIKKFPDWFSKCFIGDEPLFLMLSKYGKAKFINDFCSVYRQTVSGISTKNFSFERDYLGRIFMYKKINLYFNKKYANDIHNLLSRYYFKLFNLYWRQKSYFAALKTIFAIIFYNPVLLIEKLLTKKQ